MSDVVGSGWTQVAFLRTVGVGRLYPSQQAPQKSRRIARLSLLLPVSSSEFLTRASLSELDIACLPQRIRKWIQRTSHEEEL